MTAQRDLLRNWCNLAISTHKPVRVTMYAKVWGHGRAARAAARRMTQSFSAMRADDRKTVQRRLKNPHAEGMFDCILCQILDGNEPDDCIVQFLFLEGMEGNSMFEVTCGGELVKAATIDHQAQFIDETVKPSMTDIANMPVEDMFGKDVDD